MKKKDLQDARIVILKAYGDFLYSHFGSDLQSGEMEVTRIIVEEFNKLKEKIK